MCRDGFCTYPECVVNDDCTANKACVNRKCVDPCVGSCGINAVCITVRHAAVCSCPEGYGGSPFVSCEKTTVIAEVSPECLSDDHCPDSAACVNSRCEPACHSNNCGINARCLAIRHRARCVCSSGFDGDAYTGCYSGKFQTDFKLLNS